MRKKIATICLAIGGLAFLGWLCADLYKQAHARANQRGREPRVVEVEKQPKNAQPKEKEQESTSDKDKPKDSAPPDPDPNDLPGGWNAFAMQDDARPGAGNRPRRSGRETGPQQPSGDDRRRTKSPVRPKLPPGLPSWYLEYDEDLDGQVALFEWKAKGGTTKEFRALDLNGDGFVTVEELILAGKFALAKETPAPTPTPTPEPTAEKPPAIPDPGNMVRFRNQVGSTIYVEVTGIMGGGLWGTDLYTDDSSIAAAAVHAGLLAVGEKGVVKVRVLPGYSNYVGSVRNGVQSGQFDPQFGGSYTLESGK